MSAHDDVAATEESKISAADSQKKSEDKPCLNEREQKLLNIAVMRCLKSGLPEINYNKFVKYGEFNTMKTATNTWGKIRAKLLANLDVDDDDGGENEGADTPKTPKTPKTKSTPKKRSKNADNGEVDEDASPKPKKQRSSPKKTTASVVKAEPDANNDADKGTDASADAGADAGEDSKGIFD